MTSRGTLSVPDYNLAKFGHEGNPIWDLNGMVVGLQWDVEPELSYAKRICCYCRQYRLQGKRSGTESQYCLTVSCEKEIHS